jgi:chromosome segregation ATPase
MRLIRRLATVALGAAVGCATIGCAAMAGDCDPTGGGLFRGVACSSTGGFDRRIQERRTQQTSLLTRKAELAKEQSQLEAQRDDLTRDLEAKQAEYTRAERQLASVRSRIASGRGNTTALQAEKKRLEGEVARKGGAVDAVEKAEAQRRARIAQLEQEQKTLNEQFDALTER